MVCPTLETERLVLRPFDVADFEPLAALSADAAVMQYIGDGHRYTRAETWRALALLIGHWQLRGYGQWAVVDRATGAFVGRAGLYNPEGWPGLEVGWLIARTLWGRGLATEAGRAALDFAFTRLGAARVISLIQPGNAASARVAEKLGAGLETATLVDGIPALVYAFDRTRWNGGG